MDPTIAKSSCPCTNAPRALFLHATEQPSNTQSHSHNSAYPRAQHPRTVAVHLLARVRAGYEPHIPDIAMAITHCERRRVDESRVDGRGEICGWERLDERRVGRDSIESVVGEEDERGTRCGDRYLTDVVRALHGLGLHLSL